MDINLQRVLDDLVGRLNGPLHLRFFMQPAMALFFGIRDGLKDGREHRPAYFWAIFTDPSDRSELIRNGIKSVIKILIAALVLDAIYQVIELHRFYAGEAILVAFLLAFVPYLFIRGPVNRLVQWWASRQASEQPGFGASR